MELVIPISRSSNVSDTYIGSSAAALKFLDKS